jgi:hypothetical protein
MIQSVVYNENNMLLSIPVARGLRCGTAAARLVGLWVRIPSGAWMSVSCECCVLSGRGLCVGLITRPRSPTDCDRESSIIRRSWPAGGCCAMQKEMLQSNTTIYFLLLNTNYVHITVI